MSRTGVGEVVTRQRRKDAKRYKQGYDACRLEKRESRFLTGYTKTDIVSKLPNDVVVATS